MKRLALALTLFLAAAALWGSQRRNIPTRPQNPLAQYVLPSHLRIAGRIEERLPAGSYVYFRVRDALEASHWIVTLHPGSPGLDTVDVEATVYARAESFHSQRLGRDFSPLWFGTVHAAASCTTSTYLGKKEVP